MLRTRPARSSTWLLGAGALLLNALLLWYFHDRYWYPTDDGFFAHIAERIVAGEALHRDVQDIHPGLIHLLHAQAMSLFGVDMVSLRYPLIAAGLVQSVAVFLLLRRVSLALAALTSIAATALGIVQFVDPTPNWHALALACVTAWWLHRERGPGWVRWSVVGFLVGVILMLRHLTGVWVGMAAMTLALNEHDRRDSSSSEWSDALVGRFLFLLMLVATCWYMVRTGQTSDVGGVLLISSWPLVALTHGSLRSRTSNRSAILVCTWLGLGCLVAVLPVIRVFMTAGALGAAVENTVGAALAETAMPFFESAWYSALPIVAAHQALTSLSLPLMINGVYWCAVLLLFPVNGVITVRKLWRGPLKAETSVSVIAAFFGMVCLFFHGPLYLYYAVGLVMVSVVAHVPRSRAAIVTAAVFVAFLGGTALYFHAGQPRQRTAVEILQGHRVSSAASSDARRAMSRATLRLDASDVAEYERVIAAIQRLAPPGAAIWVLPNDAELYFLAERRNPFRFYNTAFGLRSRDDLAPLIAQVDSHPPPLVVYRPGDKYEDGLLSELIEHVRHVMQIAGREGPFELYVPRAD